MKVVLAVQPLLTPNRKTASRLAVSLVLWPVVSRGFVSSSGLMLYNTPSFSQLSFLDVLTFYCTFS